MFVPTPTPSAEARIAVLKWFGEEIESWWKLAGQDRVIDCEDTLGRIVDRIAWEILQAESDMM